MITKRLLNFRFNLILILLILLSYPLLAQDNSSETEKPAVENQAEETAETTTETEADATEPEVKKEPTEEDLIRAKIEKLKLELELLKAENNLKTEKQRAASLSITNEINLLREKNSLEAEKIKESANSDAKEKNIILLKQARLLLANHRMNLKKNQMNIELLQLKTDNEKRSQKEAWEKKVNREIDYTTTPYKDGILTISDRRVDLNGPIHFKMAGKVVEDIEFFNNKSEKYPIFIVINMSPGGSVMAGYQILKAMESSRAPIYVVVKSFAASMAAVITAHATQSFALPGTIFLHHQVSAVNAGNLTQQKERLRITESWMNRIMTPVAEKMGVTLDNFVKMMYEKNSDGNWQEFGDGAVKYKWVTHLAREIRELSIDEQKEENPEKPRIRYHGQEEVDKNGQPYVRLPRLQPYDVNYLYNPDHYYRFP